MVGASCPTQAAGTGGLIGAGHLWDSPQEIKALDGSRAFQWGAQEICALLDIPGRTLRRWRENISLIATFMPLY